MSPGLCLWVISIFVDSIGIYMNWFNKVPIRAKLILFMGIVMALILLTCGGCSVRKFYPAGGAVIGAAGGSLGGPAGAGLGAGVGWGMGELAKGDSELKEAKDTIVALSTGDVDQLVEKRLEEAKDNGFFDSVLEGVYDLLLIGAVLVGLWILIPLWYTRYVHNKHKESKKEK